MIYYVIKLYYDVIIRTYDVKKCIKMSHRWFKSKTGVREILSHKTTFYVINVPMTSKTALKFPTDGSYPKKMYVI